MNKRLYKEISRLTVEQESKQLLENDYLVLMDDSDTNKVYTIIKAPDQSVYKHKFIRLNFSIPDEYPYQPPKVTFVNYDHVRIHPNFYEDGKCCSTILNSWPSLEQDGLKIEAWSSSMGIETVLLTFRSFLDMNPYMHEPGGKDNSSYTDYVLYQSWETCLLRYIYDNNQPELFNNYMNMYMIKNVDNIFEDLYTLKREYPYKIYNTPCFYIYEYIIDYEKIINYIHGYYDYVFTEHVQNEPEHVQNDFKELDNINEVNCNICFEKKNENEEFITLECNHVFHINCIKRHILYNGKLCSLCRNKTIVDEKIINPETKKKIKIDGITYKKLLKKGVINF